MEVITHRSPDHFYHPISEQEMVTWTHWLPAVQMFFRVGSDPSDKLTEMLLIQILKELEAPAEVIESFCFSWNLGLFTAYEIRTPVSRDASDPLLIGLVSEQRFSVAVWGKSLPPLERITALVRESLEIREHVSRQRRWLLPLLGLGLLGTVGLLFLTDFFKIDGFFFCETSTLAVVLVGVSFATFCITLVETPENRQQMFLNRFRL